MNLYHLTDADPEITGEGNRFLHVPLEPLYPVTFRRLIYYDNGMQQPVFLFSQEYYYIAAF